MLQAKWHLASQQLVYAALAGKIGALALLQLQRCPCMRFYGVADTSLCCSLCVHLHPGWQHLHRSSTEVQAWSLAVLLSLFHVVKASGW